MPANRSLSLSALGSTIAPYAGQAAERLRAARTQGMGTSEPDLPAQPRVWEFVSAYGSHPPAFPATPDGHGFIALLEAFRATGGTAPSEFVSRLLEEHQVGSSACLAELVDTGRVFGFRWRAALWIPMFQFGADDLAPKLGAQQVRAELPSGWSAWEVASWFAMPNAALGSRSAAELLDAELDAVLRVARLEASAEPLLTPPARPPRAVAARV